MVKIRAFFITTMLIQLYVGVGISLTCGQRFHEHIISLGRVFGTIQLLLPRTLLLKWINQTWKKSLKIQKG